MIGGHVAALDQGARKRRDHVRAERRFGVGGHEADKLAAMRQKSAREMVDLIAERVGGRLHALQRRWRDAGAGREGARDRGARNAGAFGDVARTHEPPVAIRTSCRHLLPRTQQGWTFPATPS